MKKAKRIVFANVFIILVAVIYAFVLILGNVGVDKISVATVSGSYADTFAREHHIKQVNLAENQLEYFDEHYELFDYNVVNGQLVLDRYTGNSTELVVPAMIDGTIVVELTENFMESIQKVDRLYIPSTISTVGGSPRDNLTIYCTDNTLFYEKNKESKWKFELLHDSDFVNFFLGDLEFNYNVSGGTAEVASYVGDKRDVLVIPAYINGYPVTSVTMDIYGIASVVVIPETVKSIEGSYGILLYTPIFAIELFFSLLAFALALLSVNLILPRYKNLGDYMLRGNQMAAIILYVILQTGFSIYAIYFSALAPYFALIVSIVILLVYMLVVFMAGRGREQVIEVEKNIAQKTERMKSIKSMAKGMADGIEDKELRKEVQRLEEEIRFSDPVSSSTLDDVESEIERLLFKLKTAITAGDNETIKAVVDELLKQIRDRNVRCKAEK